jgi:hypothetical protein
LKFCEIWENVIDFGNSSEELIVLVWSKKMKRSQSIVGLVVLMSIGFPKASIAQVVPDGTVGRL